MEMAKIVKVFSTLDESMLISMLQSADIEVVSDSTNFQRVQYGTMYSSLTGTVLSVNSEYLAEAKAIVNQYIENKKADVSRSNLTDVVSFQAMPELLAE